MTQREDSREPRAAALRRWLAAALGVALVAIAAHAVTLRAGFVWDDHVLIEANPRLVPPLDLAGLFGGHAFGGARGLAGERVIEYYRPLSTLSLALDRALWALRPFGYHLASVLLHAAASVALLLLLRARCRSLLAALAGALLFALHPVHVEAVAWASARNELLAGLFVILSALGFDAYQRKGGAPAAIGCVAAAGVALLSKESAVTLPALAVLLAFTRRERRRPALGLALALALVTAGYLLLRSRIVAPLAEPHAFGERLLAAPALLALNLKLLVFPAGLSVFHDLEVAGLVRGSALALGLAALVAWGAGLVWAWRRDRLLALGLAWMPLALLPVSGLAGFTRPALLAERYLYLPSAGIAFVAAALVARGFSAAGVPKRSGRPAGAERQVLTGIAAAAAALVFGAVTMQRAPIWRDDITLMSRMTREAPRSPSGHMNLGAALERAGRIEEALPAYRTAALLAPSDPLARTNLANALGKSGRDGDAEAEFRAALQLRPNDAAARAGLGWLAARAKRWADSEREYRAAIPLDPGRPAPHAGLALALQNLGRSAEAESAYRAALSLDPASSGVVRNLGLLYRRTGRPAEAARLLSGLVARDPGSAEARLELGVTQSDLKQYPEAERELREALRLRPGWAEARFNLGAVLAMQARYDEARTELEATRRMVDSTSTLNSAIDAALRSFPPGR